VVQLGQQRQLAAGKALDETQLPEGSAPIERPFVHFGRHRRHFMRPAWMGDRDATQVYVEVDVGLHPIARSQSARDFDQAPAQRRQQRESLFQEGSKDLEGIAAGDGVWIEKEQPHHVERISGTFGGEKRGVHSTQGAKGHFVAPRTGSHRRTWLSHFLL
jgi:hypothetical protein